MIFLLICFIHSIYVPISETATSGIQTISRSDARDLGMIYDNLFVFAIKSKEKNKDLIESFITSIQILFGERAKFAIFDENYVEKLENKEKLKKNAMFYFTSGFKFGKHSFNIFGADLLFLIDSILSFDAKTEVTPISNISELCRELGATYFTMLATEEAYTQAVCLRNQAGMQMGPISIIKVTDELIKSFGTNSSMALFRKEDFNVVPINGKLKQLYESTFPAYRALSVEDLKSDKIIIALIYDNLVYEYVDFLFEIGTNYPEYIVGFASPSIANYIQKYAYPNQTYGPKLAVFNMQRNIFYNVDEFFSELFKKPFSADEWTNAGMRMLEKIQSGEMNESYLSEPEPEVSTSNIQKVVGSTYERFISEDGIDVVMLYKRENCPHCQKFITVYTDFARDCEAAGINSLKFGYIDVIKNSARTPFPYMRGVPHVRIFPAKNKTNHQQIRGGNNRDSLIRLINRFGLHELPFDVSPIDPSQAVIELFEMMFSPDNSRPNDELLKDYEYISELSHYVDEHKDSVSDSREEL